MQLLSCFLFPVKGLQCCINLAVWTSMHKHSNPLCIYNQVINDRGFLKEIRRTNKLGNVLYKNNNLTNYMFRPSSGHLQADIRNILGSIQIMCGREISLLTNLLIQVWSSHIIWFKDWILNLSLFILQRTGCIKLGQEISAGHHTSGGFVLFFPHPHYSYCQYHSRMLTKQYKTINTFFCFSDSTLWPDRQQFLQPLWLCLVSYTYHVKAEISCCLYFFHKQRDTTFLLLLSWGAEYTIYCTCLVKGDMFRSSAVSRISICPSKRTQSPG